MDHFTFRFRSKTRFIAIVDIVLSSMSLGLDFILIMFAGVASTSLGERLDRASLYFILVIWTAALACTAAIILQVVAAVKLLNSSEVGRKPEDALKLCRFWRAVTIFFMTLIVVNLLFHPEGEVRPFLGFVFLLANIIIRGTSLYVVVQYMQELQSAIAYSHSQADILPCYQHSSGAVNFYYLPSTLTDVDLCPPPYEECVKTSLA